MQRSEAPEAPPYAVYCDHCQASFAVGTRECVHCGRRLGGGGRPSRLASAAAAAAGSREVPPEIFDEPEEPSLGRRVGGASLWILIALGAALSRLCAGS